MDVHFPFDKEADGVTPFSLCCVCIFKVGTSEWTTSPEPGAGSCFPRCTWRRAEASCLVSRPWWSYRPTTLGRAATGKHTVKSLCKSFAVSRETEREKNESTQDTAGEGWREMLCWKKCGAILRVEACWTAKGRNINETRKNLIQRRNYDLTSDPLEHINISVPFRILLAILSLSSF